MSKENETPRTFLSNVDELYLRLAAQGLLTTLTDEQTTAIDERISAQMVPYRRELRRKEAQSIEDTKKIVLTD